MRMARAFESAAGISSAKLRTPPYHLGHPRRNTRQSGRGRVLVSSSAGLGTADFSANEERGISMQRQRIRRAALGLPVVAMALVLAACSSSTTTGGGSTSGGGSSLSGTLNGSGSTFQLTFQQSAIQAFKAIQANMTVNYGGGGSGKGRSDLAAGVVNFAGSDSPIPSDEVANFKGKTVLYFPVMLGPITMSYNLSGVSSLKLDAPTIAGIFQGKIKTWNDPALKAINPGVNLPSTPISLAVRSDSSGTTANFSLFLTLAAASTWKLG